MEFWVLHLSVFLVASTFLCSLSFHQADAAGGEQCSYVKGCRELSTPPGLRTGSYSQRKSTDGLFPAGTTGILSCASDTVPRVSGLSLHCRDNNEWSVEAKQTERTEEASNIALNKPASMSTKYHTHDTASRVVDGNTDGNLFHYSCAETQAGNRAQWISVDLGGLYEITQIKVYNRQDCCANRLIGAKVLVGEEEVHTLNQNAVQGFAVDSVIGRSVTVRMERATAQLHICELEVYGFPVIDNE